MGKRILYIVMAAVLLCVFGSTALFAKDRKGKAKGLTIAYVRPGNVEYYKYASDGVKLAGDIKGIKVIDYQSDYQAEKELANIEDAITQQVDGIILFSVSASAIDAAVVKANEAKIPIFMVYGYSEKNKDKFVGSIQSDGLRSGGLMGQWVAKNIPAGEIACMAGMLGRGDAEAYRDGFFKEALKNSKLKNVGTFPGDWDTQKAFTVMQDIITAYPNLKACFVQNEGMTMGAIRSIEEAGKMAQVKLVSQNGSPDGERVIKEGKLTATVGWSCSQESILALRMLVDHINGKKVPKLSLTPMKVITKSNLGEIVPWVPTPELVEMSWKIDYNKALLHEFAAQ
jgi:ribose transport system substrate-binding protein